MDTELVREVRKEQDRTMSTMDDPTRPQTREQLLRRLMSVAQGGSIGRSLHLLADYVGANHFLLARFDLVQEQGLDFVVCSNWPFDLVRRLECEFALSYSRTTELEKCLSLLQPRFALLPDDADAPRGLSREYCALTFNVGRTRLSLMFLYEDTIVLSPERLREVGLLCGYCVSLSAGKGQRADREFELTEREIECLFWIAEGKTSDEIATILGISRNTINNYITSVMRKTATKTRSEAIAYAVRNNLV